jgi:hypothetical protein
MWAFFLLALASAGRADASSPAFDKVLTMLQNLVAQIESESSQDDADYQAYQAWFTQQSDATSASIAMLETRLSELGAVIAELSSRQHNLQGEVGRLNGEIQQEQSQVQAAQTKRQEENEAFVKEQLDFDNSIKACEKAVELLKSHYGDGKPKESTRPAWMSLIGTVKTVAKLALAKHHPAGAKLLKLLEHPAFLQSPDFFNANGASLNDQHQDSTGEALSIVEQVQGLAETFAEDKQSSIDQESELKGAFENLMKQKQQLLASLTAQRDQQQSALNQVNQELGENQNAEATAKAQHQDDTAYLSMITKQEADTTTNYNQRVHDRTEEKTAVSGAITVLSQEAPKAFVQVAKAKVVRKAQLVLKAGCPKCHEVSAMLLASSRSIGSELLATAAMTTGSGDALQPVVAQLAGLVTRIDEQQHAEEEHKAWCEKELSDTAQTKSHHEALVEEFEAKIEEEKAIISEKQQSIADTAQAIGDADNEFKSAEEIRKKEKADFEAEHQDNTDAVEALNQAIDILADFYRDQQSLVQADREDPPAMSVGASYSKKGGGHVVATLKETREEFAAYVKHLEEQETMAVADFQATKEAYEASRAALVDAGNRFQAELQGAQLALAQAETDLADNQAKVQAAVQYLSQVGGSCNVLIANFDTRSKLRADEKTAIQQAIGILQAAVF